MRGGLTTFNTQDILQGSSQRAFDSNCYPGGVLKSGDLNMTLARGGQTTPAIAKEAQRDPNNLAKRSRALGVEASNDNSLNREEN